MADPRESTSECPGRGAIESKKRHDWAPGPIYDTNPPIETRICRLCGLAQTMADPPMGDGQWHPSNERDGHA